MSLPVDVDDETDDEDKHQHDDCRCNKHCVTYCANMNNR